MKIGIINFHFAYNYGAVLESVALAEYLSKKGFEVYTIDYRPEYQTAQYEAVPNPFAYMRWAALDYVECSKLYQMYRMIRRLFQALAQIMYVKKRKLRKDKFEKYIENHMRLTRKYLNLEDLRYDAPQCDIYISGSDQIWNPKVTAGLDPSYYLDFGSERTVRIAYAVSPCELDVSKYEDLLRRYLKRYVAISLREKQYKDLLGEITNQKISICVDPTLLLHEHDYDKFVEVPKEHQGKYILVYGIKDKVNNELFEAVAEYLTQKTKADILNVSIDNVLFLRAYPPYIISPGEFLYYVKNAEIVLTNSFHGTVFSIINKKNFITIKKGNTSARVVELANNLGISDRIIDQYDESYLEHLLSCDINYVEVYEKLHNLKIESIEFIDKTIGI